MSHLITLAQIETVTYIEFPVFLFSLIIFEGYCGYVPGVKAENVFGESYGKSSTLSGKGEIIRGFDQEPQDKFRTVA